MKIRFLRTLAVVLAVVGFGVAADSASAQQSRPAPIGVQARLGVQASPFRLSTPNGLIEGARVTSDSARRVLYHTDSNGTRRQMRFRVGYDVILSVNGNSVRNSQDVLNHLTFGWNTLEIWDRYTGITGSYEVNIQ
jgi:hypothetical protein